MEYKAIFQNLGLKATPVRISIYKFLQDKGHITAEEVLSWAVKNIKDCNRSSVYNTLNNFEKVGLIMKFKLPNSDNFVYDTKTDEHFHFIDEITGEVTDLDKSKVNITLPKNFHVNNMFFIGTKKGE